ncbi:MAG TPA: hypothetical protein DCL98_04120 [Flavobacteriales bacterium]|nr:hypothetical protein [Flavobacteriales bacterium]
MPDIRTMSDPKPVEQSLPYKTARAAEWFWLVASIVGTLYVGWLWMSANTPAWSLGLFPCISWLWYGVRRIFRLRMTSSN